MIAAPARAWNIFHQLLAEHGAGCPGVSPRDHPPDDEGRVAKMRAGGQPEERGSIASRWLQGGPGPHRVAMRCQGALGLRCATVSVDTWDSQGSRRLQAGGLSRPIVLTVPARRRNPLYPQAHAVLGPCRRCGVRCVHDVFRRVKGRALQGGSLVVRQTQGRPGPDTP